MELVKYDLAYLYAYSLRDKTHAYHNLQDNVPEDVKKRRLIDIIDTFKKNQFIKNKMEIGSYQLVLVDGKGKKEGQILGRADSNKQCIFNDQMVLNQVPQFLKLPNSSQINTINPNDSNESTQSEQSKSNITLKDYLIVKIHDVSYNSLFATPICKTTIREFNEISKGNPFLYV